MTDTNPAGAEYALDRIRLWRHRQPSIDGPRYAELDRILDGAAIAAAPEPPNTLPEAVAAYRRHLTERRRAFDALRLEWDKREAVALRHIDRVMREQRLLIDEPEPTGKFGGVPHRRTPGGRGA